MPTWGQEAVSGLLDYASLEDQALVALLTRRDESAFATLYDRHGGLAFTVAVRLLEDREKAEDVVQDVFLKLWHKPDSYAPERGRFPAWFLSVVHHRAVDLLRSRGSDRRHNVDDAGGLLVETVRDPAPAPDEQVVRIGEREAVSRALGELPDGQRAAITLAYFDGLSQSEIAARLGEPLGTVKTRIRSGMQRLKAALTLSGVGAGHL